MAGEHQPGVWIGLDLEHGTRSGYRSLDTELKTADTGE